jgi:hypothetical protein
MHFFSTPKLESEAKFMPPKKDHGIGLRWQGHDRRRPAIGTAQPPISASGASGPMQEVATSLAHGKQNASLRCTAVVLSSYCGLVANAPFQGAARSAGRAGGSVNGNTIFQRCQKSSAPPMDILRLDPLEQDGMAIAALVERHLQRLLDRLYRAFDVAGIDQQG